MISDEFKKKTDFIDVLAVSLHVYGAPAPHLEEAMQSVAEKLKIQAHFFSIPTAVYVTYKSDGEYSTRLFRVNPNEANLKKLAEIDEIGEAVIEGRKSIEEGRQLLEQVKAEKAAYPKILTAFSFGLASSGLSCFLGGNYASIVSALFIGLLIGIFSLVGKSSPRIQRVFEILAAFFAALAASLLHMLNPTISVQSVVLASLIILIPGLSLTISVTELATENLAAGTARLMGAVTVLLKLAFGVIVAVKCGQFLGLELQTQEAASAPLWLQPLALLWTAVSLAVLFQARYKDIVWVIASAVVGYSTTYFAGQILGSEMSAFFGGTVVGTASNLFARILKRPALIPLLPGIILLVPGSFGYRSFFYLFEKNVLLGLDTAASMILILISLVTGVFLGNLIVSPRRSF